MVLSCEVVGTRYYITKKDSALSWEKLTNCILNISTRFQNVDSFFSKMHSSYSFVSMFSPWTQSPQCALWYKLIKFGTGTPYNTLCDIFRWPPYDLQIITCLIHIGTNGDGNMYHEVKIVRVEISILCIYIVIITKG